MAKTGSDTGNCGEGLGLAKQTLNSGRLDNLLGHLLRHAYLAGQRAFFEVYPERTITPLAYGAFELIRLNPGISHNAVSKHLSVAKSVLTTALKQYLGCGKIIQHPDPDDGRAVCYALSPSGAEWFQSNSENIDNAETKLAQSLNATELKQLKKLLGKIVRAQRSRQP